MADNIIQLYTDDAKTQKGYPITSAKLVINETGGNIEEFQKSIKERQDSFETIQAEKDKSRDTAEQLRESAEAKRKEAISTISKDYESLRGGLLANDKVVYFQDEINKTNSSLADNTNKIDTKVDKVSGKGLSANDYTNLDKAEVAKIANKMESTKGTISDQFADLYINGIGSIKDKLTNVVSYSNNANGWYIRFEDGTQICLRDYTINLATVGAINIAMPNSYLANTVPSCNFSIISTGTASVIASVKNIIIMASNNAYVIHNSVAGTGTLTIIIQSIGRWK